MNYAYLHSRPCLCLALSRSPSPIPYSFICLSFSPLSPSASHRLKFTPKRATKFPSTVPLNVHSIRLDLNKLLVCFTIFVALPLTSHLSSSMSPMLPRPSTLASCIYLSSSSHIHTHTCSTNQFYSLNNHSLVLDIAAMNHDHDWINWKMAAIVMTRHMTSPTHLSCHH